METGLFGGMFGTSYIGYWYFAFREFPHFKINPSVKKVIPCIFINRI